ncbi:MAG: V-type ATP synthase subunit E family protein [Bacillota bacterium]
MSEAIIAKIMEDAQKIVNSTLEEGNISASKIIERANNDASIYVNDNMQASILERQEILRRRISVANLEVKKLMLAAKMQVLDATFDMAKKSILALPKAEYKAIISGMLDMASDKDVVYISERDASIITANFITTEAKNRGIKLKLAKEYANIEGGIILSDGTMDKNLSIEVELLSLREEMESKIAKDMFQET